MIITRFVFILAALYTRYTHVCVCGISFHGVQVFVCEFCVFFVQIVSLQRTVAELKNENLQVKSFLFLFLHYYLFISAPMQLQVRVVLLESDTSIYVLRCVNLHGFCILHGLYQLNKQPYHVATVGR